MLLYPQHVSLGSHHLKTFSALSAIPLHSAHKFLLGDNPLATKMVAVVQSIHSNGTTTTLLIMYSFNGT